VRVRSIAVVVYLGLSVAFGGCGGDPTGTSDAASSPHGLSAGFVSAATRHREWLDGVLSKPPTLPGRKAYAVAMRQRITDLRSIAKTDADRQLLLVVALMTAKENERLTLVLLSEAGGGVDGGRIAALEKESQVCQDEMLGWLGSIDTDLASLEEGACLAEAIEMAEDLGVQPPS
jgi:hypothetical protein